jgi:Myb-like DNA-binding domain
MLIAMFVGVAHGEVRSWSEVATKLPGRSNKDCRKRFYNEVTGGLKKVFLPWSALIQLS